MEGVVIMKVLIIYCHPSNNSFTSRVRDEFIKGLKISNHEYCLLDLYDLNFKEAFSDGRVFKRSIL